MTDKVAFELVAPTSLLLSEEVDMVVIPGAEGDFGVLIGHAPFLSTIRPGVISVYEGNDVTQRIFVAGGFAEVTPERCTVLAEEAMPVADLDRSAAEKELSDLNDDLRDAGEESERAAIERQVAIAEAKIAAVQQAG